jgi:tetratricopeptide (TPR) repeat protein
VADTLYELALVDEQTGDYETGLERARRALELLEASPDAEPLQLARNWNRVSYLHRHLLNYDEAWQAGQKALAFLDEGISAEGGESSLRLEVLSGLGYVAQRRGEQTEALELFLKAQRLTEGWSDEQRRHPDVARVYRNLGSIYGRLGEQAKARRAHEASLAVYEQVLPPDHPELAGLLINMGEGYVIDEEPDRAVPILERAYEICRQHLGEDHLHTALALVNLSNARSMLGQHAEALELQGRAIGILARTVGEDHPMYVHALGFGGELLRRSGDAEAALARQNEALARAEVVFGPDHPELTQILEEQARALEDLGRFRDAAASVRRQLAVRAPHLPEDSDVAARLTQRAEALEARAGVAPY